MSSSSSMSNVSNADQLCQDLGRISDVVNAARDLVADGQLINMAPLENEVDRLCGGIGQLPADDANRVKPLLLSLMDELDRLADEMRARQNEYESELRTLASHKNAARAYNDAPAAPKTDPSTNK